MPYVKKSRTVPFVLSDIYDVVFDIESYPKLLSFIRKVKILERKSSFITARVSVGLPVLTFSYDCLIEFKKNDYIKITLVSGPFKKLNALWKFEKINEKETKIDYFLDSEFQNPIVEMTAGAIFTSQLNHALDVFTSHLRKS
jgi:ribosome-associated toxin RatA of RatAB toxin-antitoxin module